MCWGVRNMGKFQLASVTSPSIEFEVDGKVVQSKVIKDTKKNPNFDDPVLFFDIVRLIFKQMYMYMYPIPWTPTKPSYSFTFYRN